MRKAAVNFVVATLMSTGVVCAETPREAERREAEAAISMRVLERVSSIAESTAKQYETLSAKHVELQGRLSKLMTSDEGKKLAATLDPVLAREIVQNVDTPFIDAQRLSANKRQAESLVARLRQEKANVVPGYVPPEAVVTEVHSLSAWATEVSALLRTKTLWLDDQLAIAPAGLDVKGAPTLAEVLTEYRRREHEAWSEARKKGAEAIQEEGKKEISEAARRAELERMTQEARQLYEAMRADLERERAEHEVAMQRQRDAYEQMMSDLRRELAESKAKRDAQDAETDVIAKKGDIEAERIRLRQEAQNPETQSLLAPLLAKGYTQPGQNDRLLDAQPVSFAALRQVGALERTDDGLFALAKVASKKLAGKGRTMTNRDWDRPTWGGPESWKDWTNEQRQRLLKAQETLNRLGPTLIELGLLAE